MDADETLCITCDGNGVIEVEDAGPDYFGNYDVMEIPCPDCDGSGRCPASEEWWWLGCTTCGHWVKGAVTKQQVADWLRTHSTPRMSPSTKGVTCESTCPHPCAIVTYPTASDEP